MLKFVGWKRYCNTNQAPILKSLLEKTDYLLQKLKKKR